MVIWLIGTKIEVDLETRCIEWRDGRWPIMIEKLYEAIEHYGRNYRIFEMFESHTGWLWFTLENVFESTRPSLWFGMWEAKRIRLFFYEGHEPFDTSHQSLASAPEELG
jgi:hypothetical protein